MIGELFTSESMTQVYAFLHTFMYENKEALNDLSKWMCVNVVHRSIWGCIIRGI